MVAGMSRLSIIRSTVCLPVKCGTLVNLSAWMTDRYTTRSMPASCARFSATRPCVTSSGVTAFSRNRVRTDDSAARNEATSVRSPTTSLAPAGKLCFPGVRTNGLTLAPAAARPWTTREPMVPVAPVTRMLMEVSRGGRGVVGDRSAREVRDDLADARVDAIALDGRGDVVEANDFAELRDQRALSDLRRQPLQEGSVGLVHEPQSAAAGGRACKDVGRGCADDRAVLRQHLPRAIEHFAADVV